MSNDIVLVTGLSGFIAKHVADQLLAAGWRVRGTVRSPAKGQATRETLARLGHDMARLEIVEADLTSDNGWVEAMSGCRFVCHTASPFPSSQPRDKFGLVPVARNGTLRVLEAARSAGAHRVVLTSSVVAVYIGHPDRGSRPFGEADWTNVDSPASYPYAVSKTLAERVAWACLNDGPTELSVINPSFVLGPLLDGEAGTSTKIVAAMMKGAMPAVPDAAFGVVDVRDVAAAHIAAMTAPDAAGRRFILSGGTRSLREIAAGLVAYDAKLKGKVPRFVLPDWSVKLAGTLSRQAAPVASELGRRKQLDTGPAEQVLRLRFRSPEQAIAATAGSLRQFGLVKGHIDRRTGASQS